VLYFAARGSLEESCGGKQTVFRQGSKESLRKFLVYLATDILALGLGQATEL
jgi:hypothetical protein